MEKEKNRLSRLNSIQQSIDKFERLAEGIVDAGCISVDFHSENGCKHHMYGHVDSEDCDAELRAALQVVINQRLADLKKEYAKA